MFIRDVDEGLERLVRARLPLPERYGNQVGADAGIDEGRQAQRPLGGTHLDQVSEGDAEPLRRRLEHEGDTGEPRPARDEERSQRERRSDRDRTRRQRRQGDQSQRSHLQGIWRAQRKWHE